VVLFLVLLSLAGYVFVHASGMVGRRTPRVPPPLVEMRADRGAPDYRPSGDQLEFTMSGVFENTLEAMERAEARGMTTLELELRRTKDGHLVILHDARVDRTTDGEGAAAELTLEALKGLEAGNGARVPTLEEVFDRFGERVHYQLEVMDQAYIQPHEAELVGMIRRYGLNAQTVVASRFPWVLGQVEKLNPALRTELVLTGERALLLSGPVLQQGWIDFYGIDGVQLSSAAISSGQVAALHDRGLYVAAADAMDQKTAEVLRRAGVDSISTFFTSLEEIPPEVPRHYELPLPPPPPAPPVESLPVESLPVESLPVESLPDESSPSDPTKQ